MFSAAAAEGPPFWDWGSASQGFTVLRSFCGVVSQGPRANLRNRTGPSGPPEKKHNGLLRCALQKCIDAKGNGP